MLIMKISKTTTGVWLNAVTFLEWKDCSQCKHHAHLPSQIAEMLTYVEVRRLAYKVYKPLVLHEKTL